MNAKLGHWLYRLRRRDRGGLSAAPLPQRPGTGPLIWIIGPRDAPAPRSLVELARQLLRERPEIGVLISAGAQRDGTRGANGASTPETAPRPDGVLLHRAPDETPHEVRHALQHWRPHLIIVAGDRLAPLLMHMAAEAGVRMMMVNVHRPPRADTGLRWWPGFTRTLLQRFDHVLVQDGTAARAYRTAGVTADRVEVTGPLAETAGALHHDPAERDRLAGHLAGRPVWLAAAVPPAEEDAVMQAHRKAQRGAHRLLLILDPQKPAHGAALHDRLSPQLNVALRSAGVDPREDDQVLVADTEDEMGLWYRLATITYLGGTLAGPGSLRDPLEPAALGSAILHGPRRDRHGETVARLQRGSALRTVPHGDGLGDALSELLAPEYAAQMAHNAWSVISEGGEATERTVAVALDLLAAAETP